MNHAPQVIDRELSWMGRQRRREALLSFFNQDEMARIEAARSRVDPATATVAYGVYENPFARGGGVFAVADNYCAFLASQGRSVLAFSPLHGRLQTAPGGNDVQVAGQCQVPFAGRTVRVDLLEHWRHGVRWLLLRADGFFSSEGGPSRTDPYLYDDPAQLLTDSLFLSAALPHVLAALDLRENVMVHVQDWELASAALTVKTALLDGVLVSAAVVLTTHNPYDQALPSHALRWISSRSYEGLERLYTVYQYMLPLVDAPITTVSRTFAQELTSDPLQREVFADHLQAVFRRQGLIGVDNGLFGNLEPPYSGRAVQEALEGDGERILAKKLAKRRAMMELLSEYRDDRILGHLDAGEGRPLARLSDDVPVFLMFGRLDPGQKGFDVLCRAIDALPRGRARFVLTPIVAAAPRAFTDDLQQLAAARPGEVVVYPFRMAQGYKETMGGATYAVMPSLYEPFGGATEPYLAGTPVVARATGGLRQQVVDVDSNPQAGTGVLYREDLSSLEAGGADGDWRAIQAAASPRERMAVPAYGAMVAALAAALTRASDLYRAEPALYARMLARGFSQAELYSWDRAAADYQRVYEMATEA
jgi:glycogen synthase